MLKKIEFKAVLKSVIMIVIVVFAIYSITYLNTVENFTTLILTISLPLLAIAIALFIFTQSKEFNKKQHKLIQKKWGAMLLETEMLINKIKINLKNKNPSSEERKERRKKMLNLVQNINEFESTIDAGQLIFGSAIFLLTAALLGFMDSIITNKIVILGISNWVRTLSNITLWIGIIYFILSLFAIYEIKKKN